MQLKLNYYKYNNKAVVITTDAPVAINIIN